MAELQEDKMWLATYAHVDGCPEERAGQSGECEVLLDHTLRLQPRGDSQAPHHLHTQQKNN